MTLEVLAVMVVIGLPLVIGAVYLFGTNTPDISFDSDAIVGRLREDYPQIDPQMVIFDSAGNGALIIQRNNEPVGLVWRMGRKYLTRLLDKETLVSYKINGPILTLKLKELTVRKVSLMIDDDDDITSLRLALDGVLHRGS